MKIHNALGQRKIELIKPSLGDWLLEYYFRTWKGEVLVDHVMKGNENGLTFLTRYGFIEIEADESETLLSIRGKEWEELRGEKVRNDIHYLS